ncbi:MAG: hypothetical protein WC849_03385 [Candidatus Paceibacterota bacterium]
MDKENKVDKITLSIITTIQTVIINEIGGLVYPHGKSNKDILRQSSPYIKFLPIISSIEFLGACYDELPFDTTRLGKEDIVEKRFNIALKNLFDKKYLPFTKADNDFYFYKKLRCCMIHQLRPRKGIMFTTRFESKEDKTEHLKKEKYVYLVLVLEDFYDDLKKASEKLIYQFNNKKITNKKGELAFIDIININ